MQKMTQKEIKVRLAMHLLWLESSGARGQRADFSFAKLQGAGLQGADLKGASLRYSDLEGADLRDVQLQNANLSFANLENAKLDLGIVAAGSIRGAQFTPDALTWLVLRKNWLEEQEHVQIHEM